MVAHASRNPASKKHAPTSLPSPATAETAHAAIRLARPEPTGRRHDTRDAPAPGLSGVQKAVAHAVVDSGGFGVGWCFKSTALLAVEVAFSPRTVDAALAALTANNVGGMFGIYFRQSCPQSYAEVMECDKETFNRFFHAMLEAGHYFAPSAFEAGFVSAAHSNTDIAETIAAADTVFNAW